jgi:hypothetical protein
MMFNGLLKGNVNLYANVVVLDVGGVYGLYLAESYAGL